MKTTRFFWGVALILFALILASCTLERSLSKTFLQKREPVSILIIKPDFVFKTNKKSSEIAGFHQMSNSKQEQALLENSLFLKQIEDKVFLENYFAALTTELKSYGFNVFDVNQITDFMEQTGALYQVAIAQIEIEEDIFRYHVEETFDDTVVYFDDFVLNIINVNNWYEISKLNDTQAVNNLLYASHYVMDNIEGQFAENIFTGEIKYKYNLYPIQIQGIYDFAKVLGAKYASYIFDYLMNEYVFRNFPNNQRPGVYMHFDQNYRTLSPAGDDRFIFMKE